MFTITHDHERRQAAMRSTTVREIIELIKIIAERNPPLTARQIYYQLVARGDHNQSVSRGDHDPSGVLIPKRRRSTKRRTRKAV